MADATRRLESGDPYRSLARRGPTGRGRTFRRGQGRSRAARGSAIVGHRYHIGHVPILDATTNELKEGYNLYPGSDVIITTVGGQKLTPVYKNFIVVDYFKSEMSEYDSNFVYVPLDYLQHLRTMEGRVTSIQIKLKDYDSSSKQVKEALEKVLARRTICRSTPGKTSKERCWPPSPSRRASSTCCCSSSSRWPASASWRSSA